MFKVSDMEARRKILDQYVTLKKTAVKVINHHFPEVEFAMDDPIPFFSLDCSYIFLNLGWRTVHSGLRGRRSRTRSAL